MPLTANVTVTGKSGPGLTSTAALFTNVNNIQFDLNAQVLLLFQTGTPSPKQYDLNATTTVTCVIAAGVYTVTVSQ